jgi:hypothetical protein
VVAATANLGEFPGRYFAGKQVLVLMTECITTVGACASASTTWLELMN